MKQNLTSGALGLVFVTISALNAFASSTEGKADTGIRPTEPPPSAAANNHTSNAEDILSRYVSAWKGEVVIDAPLRMGVEVSGDGGGMYAIELLPDGTAKLTAVESNSSVPTFLTDIDTLRRIDRDELSIMTAMGRARQSDPTPVRVRFPDGFRWTAEAQALYLPLTFHFFNRGVPEIIRFGGQTSRKVHGGLSTIFYYDRGLRTSWYRLDPGMHINADPEDQTNPFPSLFIVTRGLMQSRLGGVERLLQEGEAVFVPAGMAHEFWNDAAQYGEFVLIMFGEDA